MLVLGIETSCDETGAALVRDGALVAQRLATQQAHAVFGGVVPEIASREHLRLLPGLCRALFEAAGVGPGDLDGVAVSRGPGLLGGLLVGVGLAKSLCLATGAALVGVDHLMAHLLAPRLEQELVFPAVGLLVSGGHTHTYRLRSAVAFELLGRTLDDAAGECFDKAAKRLNLPYPGGRLMDELAARAEPDPDLFPRAYVDNQSLDFSFSGLKTAVVNYVDAHPDLVRPHMAPGGAAGEGVTPEIEARLARVCASLNFAVGETLRIKVRRALARVPEARALVVAGGVAANSRVRRVMAELADEHGLRLILPSLALCTDNAAMVAAAGEVLLAHGLRHGLDLEAVPRGRKIPWDFMPENPSTMGPPTLRRLDSPPVDH
ncbi:MAG: tRNA (adenosine(37)-N6)-threonylcarbamoyltransferase complex transferase subunit TsaD [Desulfovibrionaceae bacterium]